MKVYKCDRCGKLFEKYEYQGTSAIFNISRRVGGVYLDLCPNCNAELQEWLANDREQVPQEKQCAKCNHYGKLSLDCGRCDDDCSMFEPQESEG